MELQDEDCLNGSWVELNFGSDEECRGSGSGLSEPAYIVPEELERFLMEAQRDSGSIGSTGTPLDGSAHDSGEDVDHMSSDLFEETTVTSQYDGETRHRKRNWEWSSRPENTPPKKLLCHSRKVKCNDISTVEESGDGSISNQLLLFFIPTFLLSHIVAFGLGIIIGKRMTTPSGNSY
uniref:BCL2/adenovirus E1B 19 kDa protein-interacting protein 3-like n=1 Tax=Eptatretus burgeri TaxID=7764 RepID=A0A8C4R2J5_EPTBU